MILDKVSDTVKKYRLLAKGDRVVVGVSGGPDSVALLYLLNRLSKDLKLKLYIAHLDHMLRNNSLEDREFVARLARKLKLPLTSAQINVKALASCRGSIEEIARNARLGFFFKVAKKWKADKIALGHNFDDQAETVLMRILRGTGLYGLSAILPRRKIAGFEIIRPLLEIRRRDIENYLKQKKIKPLSDPSNSEDIYFRNKIRHELLPLLEKRYNRNIKEILANLALCAGCDYDYLNSLVQKKVLGSKNNINLKKFANLALSLQRLVLRLYIQRLNGNTRRITFRHIREIEDLVSNRPVNSIVDLPHGLSLVKRRSCLVFFKR